MLRAALLATLRNLRSENLIQAGDGYNLRRVAMRAVNLAQEINHYLDIASALDYVPNGLQVDNSGGVIHRICMAVTASLEVIEAAAALSAQVLLVHHGYFWKNEDPCLIGMKYRRLRALMQHDMALLAYHLPLDIHPQCGNNSELARILNLHVLDRIQPDGKRPLVLLGEFSTPCSLAQLSHLCQERLGQAPLVVPGGAHAVKRLAICTGAGQNFIESAKAAGADAFLSGEISERTYDQARELGIHYLACGHTATERFGIQALGAWVAQKFQVPVHFIDTQNPV